MGEVEVTPQDEILADAIAGALARYGVAYTHDTLADMSTANRSWKVHEVTGDDPFVRGEWLGEYGSKQEANVRCAELRRAAALQAAARHRIAALNASGAGWEVTDAMVDRAAKHLRETQQGGKQLTPWEATPKATKRKWLDLARGTLLSAAPTPNHDRLVQGEER
jgi:hypothetical protein